MDKKLIKEDIENIKYLFGYKPGKVISEQDIDYTTDEYLDIEDSELTEKKRPMRLVKNPKNDKIVGTFKEGEGFIPTPYGEKLGFEFNFEEIPVGTKFAGTEIGDFEYNDDDFLSSERLEGEELDEDFYDGWENPDNFETIRLTKFDDTDFEEDENENLYEQKTDRYMFFSNLEQIHRQTGLLLEKGPEIISQILENGHDWAQDHVATSKESIDQVFDFLMNEENDESDYE